MTFAHARNSDPATSHEAAESVKDITELQARILQCFEIADNGLTDEELVKLYNRTFGISFRATDSSLRSRRSDLHHRGLLIESNVRRKTAAGRDSIVWIQEGKLF